MRPWTRGDHGSVWFGLEVEPEPNRTLAVF